MPCQPAQWADILWLIGVLMKSKALRHLPDEDLAIVGPGCDNAVIEGIPIEKSVFAPCEPRRDLPIRIQHRCSMPSE